MRNPSAALLAAIFVGLTAPSFGLVRLDGPSRHGVSPSPVSPTSFRRAGIPRADGLIAKTAEVSPVCFVRVEFFSAPRAEFFSAPRCQ